MPTKKPVKPVKKAVAKKATGRSADASAGAAAAKKKIAASKVTDAVSRRYKQEYRDANKNTTIRDKKTGITKYSGMSGPDNPSEKPKTMLYTTNSKTAANYQKQKKKIGFGK